MKQIFKPALLCILIFSSVNGYTCEKVLDVSRQVVIDTSPALVWNLLGDFNGLNKWHPVVTKSKIYGKGTEAGDIRVLTLSDGGIIYDELIDYDFDSKVYTYKLIGSPLPIDNYIGSLKITSNEQNSSIVTWSSNFTANGISDEEAIKLINDIYDAGLNELPKYFNP